MRPRFAADYRALLFALVIFPLGPSLILADTRLLPWLIPLVLYSSYVAGVLAHNQNHCPVFSNRVLNSAYSIWLSAFYGVPTFAWIPTHNQNHHRHLNGPGDATPTSRVGLQPKLGAMMVYAVKAGIWQFPLIRSHLIKLARHRPLALLVPSLQLLSVLAAHAVMLGLALTLHGTKTGLWVYAWSFGIPVALAAPLLQATNYLQHVGCDAASLDDHSRNFTSPSFNWLFFNNGFHTVHHEHPGTHWTQYPALHQARAARIAPTLNQATPLHFWWSVLGPKRASFATRSADDFRQRLEPQPNYITFTDT
jgi:fatty acid desaturase